jgi:DNA (cytosine-5)-methyltransferase 1
MTAYYNEIDRYCCDWLSNLMDAELITPGRIDDRSIVDVGHDDLNGYERVHFFAGIGGWDHALNLAGWRGAVWTGSCPCQPFSTAGKKKGQSDERHLWPEFRRLIAKRNPPIVFGEQVARKAGYEWLSGVRTDLEAHSYAVGAANLCAAGIGKWHRRQRLYWVAVADYEIRRQEHGSMARCEGAGQRASLPWPLRQGNGRAWNGGSPASTSTVAWLRQWESDNGIRCLDDGFSSDVAIHSAFGNAIVPQVAAEFIGAAMTAALSPAERAPTETMEKTNGNI